MGFTHFDENGKAVMVDVTGKEETLREASATGKILVSREVFQAVRAGTMRKRRRSRRGGHGRNYGSKADLGTDSHVPHSSSDQLQNYI